MLGAEKVAMMSPWAGYRWGPSRSSLARCTCCPRLTHLRTLAEAPQPIGLIGAHRSMRDGDGTEFSSIRAFHSGDRLRRINWRVSLRQGTLHVESTRAEEDTAVLLIVDAMADYGISEGVGGQESALDVTVRAAAAVAEQYLQGGDRVSIRVLSPGGEYAGYGTGTTHLRRILTLLARVRPGLPRDVTIDRIDFRAAAGSVVVVLSPMLSEALASATVRLVRRGLPVIVVDPLPPGTTPVVSARQRPTSGGAGLADAPDRPQRPAGRPGRGRLPRRALERPAYRRGGPATAGAEDPAAPGGWSMIRRAAPQRLGAAGPGGRWA